MISDQWSVVGDQPLKGVMHMLTKGFREALDVLSVRYGGNVTYDCPLEMHTTIGIGGVADAWYEPLSPEELRDARKLMLDHGVMSIVAGNGSNVLFPDTRLEAVVINLSSPYFRERKIEGDVVTAGAGSPLGGLISDCCKAGLGGVEGLVGIPGTVGGALKMNAGYKSNISDCLEKVLIMNEEGELKWLEKGVLAFGYRVSSFAGRDVLLQAVFRLKSVPFEDLMRTLKANFSEKMERQPLDKKTLGSIFKNPAGSTYKSAQMIDLAGFKGRRHGGAVVSGKHANFIENSGGATAADVKGLIRDVRSAVREKFSVELETEIQIL